MFRLIVPLVLLLAFAGILRWHTSRTGRAPRLRWLPKGGSDALVQLSLFVVADILYETVRGIAESNPAVAFSNARTIVDLEQSTGLFFEQGLQAWAMGQRVLIDMANFMYVNSHFVMTTGALVWLYLRHNDRFYFVRNMFMVAMGLALVGYVADAHGAAALLPRARVRGHDRLLRERQARLGARRALLQSLRRRAEHARRVRVDGRGPGDARRPQPCGEGAVGRCIRCWSRSSCS